MIKQKQLKHASNPNRNSWRIIQVVIVCFFGLFFICDAYSQEHNYGKEDPIGSSGDYSIDHPNEGDVPGSKVIQHDSVSTAKPATQRIKSKPIEAKEEEDDALQFNFLYFIIQKFKISDILN